MQNVPNISVYEQQVLTAGTSSTAGAFTNQAAQAASDCMVINEGTVGAQVVFSNVANPTAVNSASANTTNQTRVPPGAVMNIAKGNAQYFAAITDNGSAKLFFHAGSGS